MTLELYMLAILSHFNWSSDQELGPVINCMIRQWMTSHAFLQSNLEWTREVAVGEVQPFQAFHIADRIRHFSSKKVATQILYWKLNYLLQFLWQFLKKLVLAQVQVVQFQEFALTFWDWTDESIYRQVEVLKFTEWADFGRKTSSKLIPFQNEPG